MRFQMINTREELMELVNTIGFLPFFQNEIEGFSVEECTPYELWFEANTEGPWEWREELAQSKSCIYGKFFHKKQDLSVEIGFLTLQITEDRDMTLTQDGMMDWQALRTNRS